MPLLREGDLGGVSDFTAHVAVRVKEHIDTEIRSLSNGY